MRGYGGGADGEFPGGGICQPVQRTERAAEGDLLSFKGRRRGIAVPFTDRVSARRRASRGGCGNGETRGRWRTSIELTPYRELGLSRFRTRPTKEIRGGV